MREHNGGRVGQMKRFLETLQLREAPPRIQSGFRLS